MDTTSQGESLVPFARDLAIVSARLSRRADQLRLRTYHGDATVDDARTLSLISARMQTVQAAIVQLVVDCDVHGEDAYCGALLRESWDALAEEADRHDS